MSKGLIGKRSIIYTLSKIISAILSLLSISLFTRIFDADAYGQYLLFVSYVTLICSLFFWWHRLSVYRYYHKYKDQYGSFLNTSYSSFFFIVLLLLSASVAIYFWPFENQELILGLIPFCISAAIFKSNFDLNQSLFNISRRDYLFCFSIIFRPLLFVSISMILHQYLKIHDNALMYAFIISFFLVAIISDFIIFKNTSAGGFEKKIMTKFYSYGFPLTGLFIFDYILTFSDRLLIGHYLGSEMVGMYGANYDLIKMMVLFGMIIQGYIIYPELNKTFEKNNLIEVKKIMTFNLNIFVTVFLPLCIFIIYFNNSISSLFIGNQFTPLSSELIPIFSIIFLLWGIKIHHIDYIFQLKEKTSVSMYILFFGSLINLILNFILIPRMELIGASYATLSSYFIILLVSFIISRNFLKVKIDIQIIAKTIMFLGFGLVFSIILGWYIQHEALRMVVFLITYITLALKFNYNALKPFLSKLYF